MYHLQTAGLFVVDNAYLPIHLAPHRPATTVVQVWHAAGALKRFGLDTAAPIAEPERTFLHRYYDAVVVGGEWTRGPYAAALRTPIERVLALGSPRTDFFFDEAALAAARGRGARRASGPRRSPGRALRADVPRSRASASGRRPGSTPPRLRAALPADHALVLKTHPNLDPAATATDGYDVVARSGRRDQRPAGPDRHPHHRLFVVGRRVRAPPPADRPARPRPGRVRGRPRAVPRLPDRDDRDAGDRHRRDHRGDRRPTGSTCPATTRSSTASWGPCGAARASGSSSSSWSEGREPVAGRWYPSARCPPRVRSRQPFAMPPATEASLRLIGEGIADIRSRRRLVRYLVQADIQQARRGHPPRQHLVGPRPAPPDGRLRRLPVDRRPQRRPPDYPLFIFSAILPWKWFIGVDHRRRRRRSSARTS